jgi:hypothetical protein
MTWAFKRMSLIHMRNYKFLEGVRKLWLRKWFFRWYDLKTTSD